MMLEETTVTRWSSAESVQDQRTLVRRSTGPARLTRAMTCSYISPVSILSSNNGKRLQIVQEIVDTEEKYVSCLYILKTVFEDPLQELGLIPAKDLETIFPKEISHLRDEHKHFLSKLKQSLRWWNLESCVGEMFVELFSKKSDKSCLSEQYSSYSNNFPKAISATQKASHSYHKFAQVLEDFSSNSFCEGLNLPAFLLTPIQRLPRYVLLLKQLSKNTDCSHPDSVHLDNAVEVMTQVMNDLNDSIEMSLQAANTTIWRKRQVTAKRRISRTDKEFIQVQICQRIPEFSEKPRDAAINKRLSVCSYSGSLDGTAEGLLAACNTSNRPLSVCSRTSNVTTYVGNRSTVSSGYFSEEDPPGSPDTSLPVTEESNSSSLLHEDGRRYDSQDIPQGMAGDHALTIRERKADYGKKRRSSVVLQAVLKWKHFTKKGIHKEEGKQQQNTYGIASSSSTFELGQDNRCADEIASTCHTPTMALNVDHTSLQIRTDDQSLSKTETNINPRLEISSDTFSDVSISKSMAIDNFVPLNLQRKLKTTSMPESDEDILENSTSVIADGQPFLPIPESENETCISSSNDVPDSRTVDGNPWVLAEHEKRIRSRSRDRKDSFRNSSKKVFTQPSLQPSSMKSRCSSLPRGFALETTEAVNVITPVSDTRGNCTNSTIDDNIISEPLRRLSLRGDAEEQVDVNSKKPSARRGKGINGVQVKKGRKNIKCASFRFFRWITSIKRRRRRRRSLARKTKMAKCQRRVDYDDTGEQKLEAVVTIEHVTSL